MKKGRALVFGWEVGRSWTAHGVVVVGMGSIVVVVEDGAGDVQRG